MNLWAKILTQNLSETYNEDSGGDIQALLLDTLKHLTLQGPNLIQDIHNLNVKQNIVQAQVSLNLNKLTQHNQFEVRHDRLGL